VMCVFELKPFNRLTDGEAQVKVIAVPEANDSLGSKQYNNTETQMQKRLMQREGKKARAKQRDQTKIASYSAVPCSFVIATFHLTDLDPSPSQSIHSFKKF